MRNVAPGPLTFVRIARECISIAPITPAMGCARVATLPRFCPVRRRYVVDVMKNFKSLIWCAALLTLSACDSDPDTNPMGSDAAMDVDGGVMDGAVVVGEGGVDLGECEAGQPCRCPQVEFGGSTYILCPDATSHAEAEAACASAGMMLASIETAEEQEFLWTTSDAMFPEGAKDVWIGLNDEETEGVHVWADGSPLGSYNNWGMNQPDNGVDGPDEDCVELSQYTDGQWNDQDCSLEFLGFFCEG